MDDVQLQFDPSITYYQDWNAGTTSQPGAIAETLFNGEIPDNRSDIKAWFLGFSQH
jgi:hypothetical protein